MTTTSICTTPVDCVIGIALAVFLVAATVVMILLALQIWRDL